MQLIAALALLLAACGRPACVVSCDCTARDGGSEALVVGSAGCRSPDQVTRACLEICQGDEPVADSSLGIDVGTDAQMAMLSND